MEHLAKYGISYGTPQEFQFRFNIYAEKEMELQRINSNPENTFTVGHNMFSTWTKDEF